MKRDVYSTLGWAAMVSVPIAPAFFFGFNIGSEVYTQVLTLTQATLAAALIAVAIGFFSAAGLELVGIMSGHLAVKLWGQDSPIKAAICGVIMLAYVGLGISGLESLLQKGVVMFLIAPLVYFLVGIKEQAERDEQRIREEMKGRAAAEISSQEVQRVEAAAKADFERQQEAADREHQRQLQKEELELKARNNLEIALAKESAQAEIAIAVQKTKASIANAKARKAKAETKITESFQAKARVLPKANNLSGNALRVFEALQQKPNATNVEIAESLPISPQRVGQIKKELNGSIQNGTKAAA